MSRFKLEWGGCLGLLNESVGRGRTVMNEVIFSLEYFSKLAIAFELCHLTFSLWDF